MSGIKPKYIVPLKHIIWNSAYDPISDQLLIEYRKQDSQEILHQLISLKKGKLSKARNIDLEWSSALTCFFNNTVAIAIYEDEEEPKPVSTVVYNADKPKNHKTFENTLFSYVDGENAVFQNIESADTYFALDKKLEKIPAKDQASAEGGYQDVESPMIYQDESEYYPEMIQIVSQLSNCTIQDIKGPIEYLEKNGYILIAFHKMTGSALRNEFMIVDNAGNILIREILGENLKGFGMNSFFCIRNFVLCFPDKTKIKCFDL